MNVLIVGDHFIPSHYFHSAVQDLCSLNVGQITTVKLEGSKRDQHRSQQLMETQGLDAIAVDPGLVEAMRIHDLIVVHFAPVPSTAFDESATRAVFVARSGTENVAIEAATTVGCPVFNIKGRNATAVAELSIGLMLAEGRNISRADRSIKSGGWKKEFALAPREIGGETVGLVGFGQVGEAIGKRLSGFGCEILVADPFVDPSVLDKHGASAISIEDLFRRSDYISLQARLTEDTAGMIDRHLLELMKPTAYFINVGRSRLVNMNDLLSRLQDGRIAGAGLDVFDEEPLPLDSPWRSLDNVTLTTHFAGDSIETNKRSARLVATAMANFLDTGDATGAVNASDLGSR